MPDQLVDVQRVLRDGQLHFVVFASERLGDASRVCELVRFVLTKSDRECDNGPTGGLGHQRHDHARVDSAREHRAERHIAHQPISDGLAEQMKQFLAVFLQRPRLRIRIGLRIRPVLFLTNSIRVDDQNAAWAQLVDSGDRCPRSGNETEAEVEVDRFQIELGLNEPTCEDRLQLGAENDNVINAGPVEGLHTHPVARQYGYTCALIPDRHAEFATKPGGKAGSIGFIEVGKHLGVAAGAEDVSVKVAPELGVVIELAVLDRDNVLVLAQKGLVPALDIDDRKPAHAERDAACRIRPSVARPAVGHDVRHRVEDRRRKNFAWPSANLDDSTDAAHAFHSVVRSARFAQTHEPPNRPVMREIPNGTGATSRRDPPAELRYDLFRVSHERVRWVEARGRRFERRAIRPFRP